MRPGLRPDVRPLSSVGYDSEQDGFGDLVRDLLHGVVLGAEARLVVEETTELADVTEAHSVEYGNHRVFVQQSTQLAFGPESAPQVRRGKQRYTGSRASEPTFLDRLVVRPLSRWLGLSNAYRLVARTGYRLGPAKA